MLPVLLRMLLSSQMKEIASNKGEKVQPQVCVTGLSQRKFSEEESNRNLHPRVKVDQAGRPLPPKENLAF